jgi:hypothetical protein
MIEGLLVQFPIKEFCLALSVSQSSFYKWARREQSIQAGANAELLKEIRRVSNDGLGIYPSGGAYIVPIASAESDAIEFGLLGLRAPR